VSGFPRSGLRIGYVLGFGDAGFGPFFSWPDDPDPGHLSAQRKKMP
jgi:hypothetical protein